MNIVSNLNEWLDIRKNLTNKTIGFVPTMGHLHTGHLSLCQRAHNENDITVVSIFVNPTQFNQAKDFNVYPRTLEQDQELLVTSKVDYLLLPKQSEIYADNYQIQINETELSTELEGAFRPGHFNGMLTIVLKLMNLTQPSRAYFGEKDYQQLLLIKKMVAALFLPVDIVSCPTVRAEDGLALSSRNSRLTDTQRQKATYFAQLLQSSNTLEKITEQLKLHGFQVDYIAEKWQRRLGAVWLDDIRLIDNISIK
jgi:pantoate--beta-alanine ligase